MPGANYCAVFGCTNNSKQNPQLTFFSLPKNVERRNSWISALGRKDLLTKRNAYVCSTHFLSTMLTNKRLRKDAVPSVNIPKPETPAVRGFSCYMDKTTEVAGGKIEISIEGLSHDGEYSDAENKPGTSSQNANADSTKNEIKVFCPKCNTKVLHTAEGIQQDQNKALIAKVYHYLEQEFEELKKMFVGIELTPLSKFCQRTALATGVTETMVLQIMKEEQERNAAKIPSPEGPRRACKRPMQTNSLNEDSDDNTDDGAQPAKFQEVIIQSPVVKAAPQEYHRVTLPSPVVKAEPLEYHTQNIKPEFENLVIKLEPEEYQSEDAVMNPEPVHEKVIKMPQPLPFWGTLKIEPPDEDMNDTNPTFAINDPVDNQRKGMKKQRKSDVAPSQQHIQGTFSNMAAPSGVRLPEELFGNKTPRSNKVLNTQARTMIFHVNTFMKFESEHGVVNLKQVQKRTAMATNTSVATVRRILKEGSGEQLSGFKTPGKRRPRAKPVTGVDTFGQGVIKRCIHNFHLTEKELITAEKLRRKLQKDINFSGSERSLRRIISNLGFKWKRTENNRQILIERSYIRYQRIEYLKRIREYREEGRPIVYTDESYVDSSPSTPKAWSDESKKGIKKPILKGQRVVIIHAGSETGFVPNTLLTFKSDVKTGDCHDCVNFQDYKKWLRTQLIPNLPNHAVVVFDNASYHNEEDDPAPKSNARKEDMQTWLAEKRIFYTEDMLKPQLYNLIKTHKDQYKRFSIDTILAENNHDVLRLPPYHPDLNPIEMAWAPIKGYVSSQIVNWSVQDVTNLVQEKEGMMGSDWSKLCQKVKDIEEQYVNSDHVVDAMTEDFIIRVDDDDSDSIGGDVSDVEDEGDDEDEGDEYDDG